MDVTPMGLVVAVAGALVGAASSVVGSRLIVGRARRRATHLLEEGRCQAQQQRDEAEAEALRQSETWQKTRTSKRARAQQSLDEYRAQLTKREAWLDELEGHAVEDAARLEQREGHLDASQDDLKELQDRTAASRAAIHRALEERCGTAMDTLRKESVELQVSTYATELGTWVRNSNARAEQMASTRGKETVALALQRYNGIGHLERLQNTWNVGDGPTLAALGDTDGRAYAAFEEHTGCTLRCDPDAGTLTVRGDDPLERELARRVLKQVIRRQHHYPDKIEGAATRVRKELKREVIKAGRQAMQLLDTGVIHPEILDLVGRLRYRLSYSQNQWKHAIEVGHLAGMLADELGVDRRLARRGGLLHDIGKALTHEREGAHAVLGAEVARRCGENEIVANAIGSHHNDEPPNTAVALLVTAADALSGARPGARREAVTSYLSRIEELQRIAGRRPHVERVDIMHAGREIRVIVADDERGDLPKQQMSGGHLTDQELYPLAQEIAREIEEEMVFPGQIKVTVIRQSRSISVAR